MEVIGFGDENSQEKPFHLQNDRWFGRPVLTFAKGSKENSAAKVQVSRMETCSVDTMRLNVRSQKRTLRYHFSLHSCLQIPRVKEWNEWLPLVAVSISCGSPIVKKTSVISSICFFFLTPTWIFTMTRKNVNPRKNVQSGSGSVSPES